MAGRADLTLVQLAERAEQAFASNVPPSDWGPKAWDLLHAVAERLPCPTCRDAGVWMMNGCHDLVNFHKGDPLEKPEDLCQLAKASGLVALRTGSICRLPAVMNRPHRATPDIVTCPERDRAKSRLAARGFD